MSFARKLMYGGLAIVILCASSFGSGLYLGHKWWYAPEVGSVTECFVPAENCTQFVVDAVDMAEKDILVQAYNYTSPPILEALAKAKGRGIAVRVILDKSNEQERYTGGTFTKNHGIPVLTDYTVAIAHNKVMVIDGKHVLTGSFNFTVSAQKRNAENMMLCKNCLASAKRYTDNWKSRAAVSREFNHTASR